MPKSAVAYAPNLFTILCRCVALDERTLPPQGELTQFYSFLARFIAKCSYYKIVLALKLKKIVTADEFVQEKEVTELVKPTVFLFLTLPFFIKIIPKLFLVD